MDMPHTLQAIGMWGILVSVILLSTVILIINYSSRFRKDKVLLEKLKIYIFCGWDILAIFILLSLTPLFYSDEVPLNIKVGLIVGLLLNIFFSAWDIKHTYNRYKQALKMRDINKMLENPSITGVKNEN